MTSKLAPTILMGAAVCGALSLATAYGQDPGRPPADASSAVLAAVAAELPPNYEVVTARLAYEAEGRKAYTLEGKDTVCVAIAAASFEGAQTEALTCSNDPTEELQTSFDATTAIVWTGPGSSNIQVSNGPVKGAIHADRQVAVVKHGAQGARVQWTAADGATHGVEILSAEEQTPAAVTER